MSSLSPINASWLDRPLPFVACVILALLCALIPTAYVAKQYQHRHDLTQLLFFAQKRQAKELPEVQALNVPTNSVSGYDGQFYAQIALDPSLRRPEFRAAIDAPAFRAQRITLPVLAYILGGGSPQAILRAYALLNLGFWYLLFAALLWWTRPANIRSFLAIFAIVLGTGALICIQRALTDLPASTLGYISIYLEELPAALVISIAILTKPTSGLFLIRYLLPLPKTLRECGRRWAIGLLALVLPALWLLYIFHVWPDRVTAGDNFSYPLGDWSQLVVINWKGLASIPCEFHWRDITHWEWALFEFLALASMTVQGVFLLLHRRWSHPIWIMGIGFAVLFFFLNTKSLAEQIAYGRTLFPLTIAFNLLLLEIKRGPLFFLYLFMGNVGLLLCLHDMLGFVFNG